MAVRGVDDAVGPCSGNCLVTKDLAPNGEHEIRRKDQRRVLRTGGVQLKEVGCILVKGVGRTPTTKPLTLEVVAGS